MHSWQKTYEKRASDKKYKKMKDTFHAMNDKGKFKSFKNKMSAGNSPKKTRHKKRNSLEGLIGKDQIKINKFMNT